MKESKRVTRTLGLVRGKTIRTRHIGRNEIAALRGIVGGEVPEQALDRIIEETRALGANAVISTRFQTLMVMMGAADCSSTARRSSWLTDPLSGGQSRISFKPRTRDPERSPGIHWAFVAMTLREASMSDATPETPRRRQKNRWLKDKAAFLQQARADLDWEQLAVIRRDVGERRPNKAKYLDAEKWLASMWTEAKYLGLHRPPAQRLLDLGTGPGFFPHACRVLGHEVWALDMPGTPLYDVMCLWTGIDVVPHAIRAQTLMPPFPVRFDLVTAHRVGCHAKGRQGNKTLFDLDDWGFFLDDVRNNLLQPTGGRLLLKMIAQEDFSGLKFDDKLLQDYFASRGAVRLKGPHRGRSRYFLFDPLR